MIKKIARLLAGIGSAGVKTAERQTELESDSTGATKHLICDNVREETAAPAHRSALSSAETSRYGSAWDWAAPRAGGVGQGSEGASGGRAWRPGGWFKFYVVLVFFTGGFLTCFIIQGHLCLSKTRKFSLYVNRTYIKWPIITNYLMLIEIIYWASALGVYSTSS